MLFEIGNVQIGTYFKQIKTVKAQHYLGIIDIGFLLSAGMNVSVRELRLSSEPDSSYFLRLDWKGRGLGSGFRLLLTDGQSAWRGDGRRERLT